MVKKLDRNITCISENVVISCHHGMKTRLEVPLRKGEVDAL